MEKIKRETKILRSIGYEPIGNVIEILIAAKDEIEELGGKDLVFCVDEDRYESRVYKVEYSRPMTAAEIAEEAEAQQRDVNKYARNRRKLYEELKKEFEG